MRVRGTLGALLLFLSALVPALLRAESPLASGRLEFQLVLQVPMAPAFEGSLVLRRVAGDEAPILVPVRRGQLSVTASVPPGTRWEVRAELPGYWAAPAEVFVAEPVSEAPQVERIALWPMGTIAGSVRLVDPQEKMPRAVVVATVAPVRPAGQLKTPRERLSCPIDDQGRWQCSLPAVKLDLALSADGFIPHYRWGVEVPFQKTLQLGMLELRRGASVSGWVDVEEGKIDEEACIARLVPLLARGGEGRIAEQLQRSAGWTKVRKDGFFQLTGVAPGSYLLEVEQPSYAPARAFPVEVWPNSESSIRQPLTLKRPVPMELAVSPALDWLGKPWRARIFRASEFSAGFEKPPVFDGPVAEDGRVVLAGQAPGRFRLTVFDSRGNRLFAEERKVATAADGDWGVEVDLITVRGRITLGKEPLPATLWFGGRFGAPAVEMTADEEGAFHGVLPKGGIWRIEIAAEKPRLESFAVHRVKADAAGRASVEIALPDTRVFGRVLDQDGRHVAEADVSLSTESTDLSLQANEHGEFDTRGLQEGFAQVVARSPGEDSLSDITTLFLTEGRPVGPVELRLKRMKPVVGKMVSPLGPVVGASVDVISRRPDFLSTDGTRTDLAGGFRAQTAATAASVLVIASPPGFALRVFELPADGRPALLAVAPEAGTLEVGIPYSREELAERELTVWILQNGMPLPLSILARWVAGHGEDISDASFSRLHIPALAPGEYRACFVPRQSLMDLHREGWNRPLSGCVAGALTADATLRLDLPREGQEDKRGALTAAD